MATFTAIDFETANAHPASACAIGLVKVVDHQIVGRWEYLIRPPADHAQFLPINVSIHGIEAKQVAEAATWPQLYEGLCELIGKDPICAHNMTFDWGVWRALAAHYQLPELEVERWCTLQLARRHLQLPSNRLPNVISHLDPDFELEHHSAISDAEACARIALRLLPDLGTALPGAASWG